NAGKADAPAWTRHQPNVAPTQTQKGRFTVNQTAPPQTVSPETQVLIDLCHQIVGGDLNRFEDLKKAIAQRQADLDKATDGFFAERDKQGPEFKEKFKAELTMIEHLFGEYDKAMEDLLSFEEDKKLEIIGAGAKKLAEVSTYLRRAYTAYEQRYL